MKHTRVLLAALAASGLGFAALPAAPASAHADYDSSTPTRGEQLAIAPPLVEITFTQEVQKIAGSYSITVNKDRGLDVTLGQAVVNDGDRTKMSVPLQPNLDDGRYVVNWSNVSDADGDANLGAFSFYVNHAPTAVDLANDAALEQIGPDGEAPATGETSTPGITPTETVAASASPTSDASKPTSAATPSDGAGDDEGSSNRVLFVVIAIVVVVIIAGGAFALVRSRSS